MIRNNIDQMWISSRIGKFAFKEEDKEMVPQKRSIPVSVGLDLGKQRVAVEGKLEKDNME